MIRFNRLLPLLSTISPFKINRNFITKNITNIFTIKSVIYPTKHISTTLKVYDKDIVSFEEFKTLTDDESAYIIDVREPEELKDTGVIPGSVNIPLGEIENALKNLSDDEFEKKYGREKPDSDTHVVFSCQKGRRSQAAMEIARQHGFKNSRNYLGGWAEWAEKHRS